MVAYLNQWSLNMEQEAQEREKEKERAKLVAGGSGGVADSNVQTLDTMQALCLPLGASISLLVMFFFFDSMQMLFAICTATDFYNELPKNKRLLSFYIMIIATVALAFLLLPMCQYVIRPCSDGKKISFGVCGRFTGAELLSFSLALFIVCIWVLTGHWLLMDGKYSNYIELLIMVYILINMILRELQLRIMFYFILLIFLGFNINAYLMCGDKLFDISLIYFQAHRLSEILIPKDFPRYRSKSLKVTFSHSLRPQLFPSRGQGPFCNTRPDHINNFEAYDNVVVLLPELSKGEVCALRNLKAALKYVFGKKFLEIGDHLLVHGL
ncbi:hypothetical protein J437_LFUL006596 [Ladona fulva]|uniref:Uncharacterized protein n=1 Tax=Ladona fulva TaxID=123851 RepID=A0A8K0KIB1_LADFU|nr:hypothetical protein J437_LFUL006596 [Ladona fulva]